VSVPSEYFQIAVAAAFGLIGWLMHEAWDLIKKLQESITRLQSELPRDYVQKDDYKQDIGRVHELLDRSYEKLDRIYEKLDGKEDKSR